MKEDSKLTYSCSSPIFFIHSRRNIFDRREFSAKGAYEALFLFYFLEALIVPSGKKTLVTIFFKLGFLRDVD